MTTVTYAVTRAMNIRQGPTEPTKDYTKGFKQECDVLTSFLGEDFLHHLVEQHPEYQNETDNNKGLAMKKSSFK